MSDALVVFCTCPNEQEARNLAETVVSQRLAACVNIVPGIRSIYRWKGKLCDDAEALMVIKTTAACFDSLRAKLVELHPYDCPEVIALEISDGHTDYLDWLTAQTKPE
jgi:periplasmic divalent cation tolerance protein